MEDDINKRLYDKFIAEQKQYENWLMSQPLIEIIRHSYDLRIRDKILAIIKNGEVEKKYALAIFHTGVTLEDLLIQFKELENKRMQIIRDMLADRGNRIICEVKKRGR